MNNKLRPVTLRRNDKIRLLNLIRQLGLVNSDKLLHLGLVRVWVPKKLPNNAHTVKTLITQFEDQLYFRCIPQTRRGVIERKKFNKIGFLAPNSLITKSVVLAAHMNKELRRPILNSKAFIVAARVKDPEPFQGTKTLYDTVGKRCVTMFAFEVQLLRNKAQALKVTKEEMILPN